MASRPLPNFLTLSLSKGEPVEGSEDGVIGLAGCPWRHWMLRFRRWRNEVHAGWPQASKEKRSMEYFAGLDVSVKETSVCVVDPDGRIVHEAKVASEPEALIALLSDWPDGLKRIGLEAGPLSQWLWPALA